ncbi:hypothetical protein [Arthrobacter sp. Soil782]|uniref:hypothetical protein n=1 Tax=Arthrobacter sp. Soil782 TaxID=1736410 RepID=UPI0012FBC645|nr:hypothetical protein [Arthrobacter sp. Soil782]
MRQPDVEPEIVCPTGHLSVSLDEARLGPSGGFPGRRPVDMSGVVRNDASVAVDVWLSTAVNVVGINSAGEVEKSYWLDLEYTPPTGDIRPYQISLAPKQALRFSLSEVSDHPDWANIKYWLVDPQHTLLLSHFTEISLDCDTSAQIKILNDPIPNRP